MQPLQPAVLAYIRKHDLLRPGDRVSVAVSGGADSVALLRLLLDLRAELGIVLSAVHSNHELRGIESDDDQKFVADLAAEHGIEFHHASGDARIHAAAHRLSLETAARDLRYKWFRQLLLEKRIARMATAHTLDDQAETVILRLARGAGSRGLAGIYPELALPTCEISELRAARSPAIVRPLLATARKDLEAYLRLLGQSWREDPSNRDLRHTRNRVRHTILPTLERDLNPALRSVLADTAEIARAEESYWANAIRSLLRDTWKPNTKRGGGSLAVSGLLALPLALQRRLIRAAAESLGLQLEFRHVENILELGSKPFGTVVLSEQWQASVQRGTLRFDCVRESRPASEYEHHLLVPGAIDIPQIGSRFEARILPGWCSEGYNREHLLDRACLSSELVVRNWRPGDRYWPAHRKEPKKVKELLQERHVLGVEKKLWPVVVNGTDVVWIRGFPVPVQFQPRDGKTEAVLVEETACTLQDEPEGDCALRPGNTRAFPHYESEHES